MVRIGLWVVAGILVAAVIVVAISGWLYQRRVQREMAQMAAVAAAVEDRPAVDLAALPAPVQRYFAYSGVLTHAPVRLAYVRHGGTFRAGEAQGWLPITGEEVFSVNPPGFIWKGTIQMVPGMTVTARDYYIESHGNMLIRMLGTVTIDDATGPAIDKGAMLRYWAEAAWFPTALLPGPQVQWEAIDDNSARLIVSDADRREEMTVVFDAEGRIVTITSAGRQFKSGNVVREAPWGGTYGDYREVDGLRIPFAAEVVWHFPEGDLPYARFSLNEVLYDDAAAAAVTAR